MYRRLPERRPLPPLVDRFGIRSPAQLRRDLGEVLSHLPTGDRFTFDLGSTGLLRPDLSLPAYAGLIPRDGLTPVFNFFDRTGGGRGFRSTVTRSRMRDHRGGRLSYDEHDGTDFVCPPGTPLCAAAPGVVVATRDNWLRGGLTVCVDHGDGVVTQYTHLASVDAAIGQEVGRGEVIATSGHSGLDMTQFFPWVPPHVHFMVWLRGRPVDPYHAPGEDGRPATWAHGNQPRTADGPLADDRRPAAPSVDRREVERAIGRCRDPRIRDELERAPGDAARVAVLEDSLHHDRPAWPAGAETLDPSVLRPAGDPSTVRLTLPLTAEAFRGARAADTPWTRP